MKKINLSLLIPAYNEEKIIMSTLEKVILFLSEQKYTWEILIVDDGSSDSTGEIVKKIKDSRVNLHKLDRNYGKGAALRFGVAKAEGENIIFSDADLSVPIENLILFMKELDNGTDCVVGSRRARGAKIEIHQPIIRESMGRFYTFLTKLMTGVNLSDFTCGFKGFKSEAGKKIFERSLIDRWAYDSEIIFLADKFGYKIKEIPISWQNRFESRVSLGSAVFTSFRDLIKIRINDFLGKYD